MAQNGIFGDAPIGHGGMPDDRDPPEVDAVHPDNYDANGDALPATPPLYNLPTEADFDALRASVPPAPKFQFPFGAKPHGGEPVHPCAPERPEDVWWDRPDPVAHARAVADVANDLRSRGGRVSLPPRRRSRLRDRFLRWVFSVAEDALEDLAERFIEAKMRLNVGAEDLDPWPEPLVPGFGGGRWGTTPFDLEHPEYEEEIPFANREYCGIFGRGGLGR